MRVASGPPTKMSGALIDAGLLPRQISGSGRFVARDLWPEICGQEICGQAKRFAAEICGQTGLGPCSKW
jgi:hypothetical protein